MPNLNRRFDWAQMGNKNMQISGIFSKIKMPILNGGLCAAMLLVVIPAHAAYFSLDARDPYIPYMNEGGPCAEGDNSSDYIMVGCACGPGVTPGIANSLPLCYEGMTLGLGCKFESVVDPQNENYFGFCTTWGTGANPCTFCNCPSKVGKWTSIGSNRVSRTDRSYKPGPSSNIRCVFEDKTTYGCAAEYYTTASTPSASMICSRCPGLTTSSGTTQYGDSSDGNTSITGCYQPTNTTFKDSVGLYRFTSACSYTK